MVAVMLLSLISAGAAEISSEYGVGTSNTALFGGMVEKLPFGTHYVYWRESQYVYALAYSETLAFDGTSFSGEDVTIVEYDSGNGYQRSPTISTYLESGFELYPDEYLVYSDLGYYPDLIERGGVQYEALACIILCSFALWFMLDRLVHACKRSR